MGSAFAHGFGERYELPIPLTLFTVGAGLAVLLSFVAMIAFLHPGAGWRDYPRFDLLATRPGRLLASAPLGSALRIAGVLAYLLVIVAGFAGAQNPFKNIAPIMVWVVAWVGLAYVVALLGNLWALVNPFDTLFRWLERLYAGAFARRLALELPYPERLGVWPAAALFLGFAWMELVWEGADSPARLAAAIVGYSIIAWLGMWLFGREEWLRRGEVFSVVYGYLARFAPLESRSVNGRREWNLRPHAVGLLPREPLGPSEIVLVIALLAAVSFDGFLETPAWSAIVEETEWHAFMRTAGLIGATALFVAAYLFTCGAVVRLGSRERTASRARAAGLFVFTLVPIAIAYHVAHYLSFFAMAAQYLVPLASDPLGQGWDLFGGARYFVRIGVLDSRLVWYLSLAAIVVGHVLAVYLAHLLALREYPDRRSALRSQYPMAALMVAYTMTSLWIIAQPIVTASQ